MHALLYFSGWAKHCAVPGQVSAGKPFNNEHELGAFLSALYVGVNVAGILFLRLRGITDLPNTCLFFISARRVTRIALLLCFALGQGERRKVALSLCLSSSSAGDGSANRPGPRPPFLTLLVERRLVESVFGAVLRGLCNK